jgi:uncharacterized protein
MAALYANEPGARRLTTEEIIAPITDLEWRSPTKKNGKMTVRGYAAVFDRYSLDLGGFRERIAREAFDDVLKSNPTVLLVWEHDAKRILAGTANGSLELRKDYRGLRFWAEVLDVSYAQDLRKLMEAGLISQASFAMGEIEDDWYADDNGIITRTIQRVGLLADVTITGMGAYPQSESLLVRTKGDSRELLQEAVQSGRLEERHLQDHLESEEESSQQAPEAESTAPQVQVADDSPQGSGEKVNPRLEEVRARAKATTLELLRELKERDLWKKQS